MRFRFGYAIISIITARLAAVQQPSMTQILLVRHAVNDFVKTGRLAGWTPDVHLNEDGAAQAEALGQRLSAIPIHQIYSSPLERTMETAKAIQKHHAHISIQVDAEIGEVRYGDWQGKSIASLQSRKMWHVIQEYPSRAIFPNGEALRDVQTRAVNTVERITLTHPRELVVIVTHADVIKMVLAHYLGMHLDAFQRIMVAPASISALSIGYGRPYIMSVNDTAHLAELERSRAGVKSAPAAT